MLYSKLVTELDEWQFQQKLDRAIEEGTSEGDELTDIHFSTCPAALSPFADTCKAEIYAITRYTALLTFCHKNFPKCQKPTL